MDMRKPWLTSGYKEYIQSLAWYSKREAALARAERKCQKCGAMGVPLEVHHLTYVRLYDEAPEDLMVVCVPCHDKEEQAKDVQRSVTRAQNYERAKFNGWASRRYGDDWEGRDPEQLEREYERYNEWRENQY